MVANQCHSQALRCLNSSNISEMCLPTFGCLMKLSYLSQNGRHLLHNVAKIVVTFNIPSQATRGHTFTYCLRSTLPILLRGYINDNVYIPQRGMLLKYVLVTPKESPTLPSNIPSSIIFKCERFTPIKIRSSFLGIQHGIETNQRWDRTILPLIVYGMI